MKTVNVYLALGHMIIMDSYSNKNTSEIQKQHAAMSAYIHYYVRTENNENQLLEVSAKVRGLFHRLHLRGSLYHLPLPFQ